MQVDHDMFKMDCHWKMNYLLVFVSKNVIRAPDQSIIDRQDIQMQILLVADLKIVLFTSKRTVTNFMSVRCWLYKSTLYDTCSQVEC